MKLITNNPKFKSFKNKRIEVILHENSYMDILEITRDYVHRNYRILTHPLYGSVKPNETVYRTILIEENDKLDNNSVMLISEAIETFKKFKKNKITPNWTEQVKDDFSVIDYDLLKNAIERII